jgi:hypothetical protein
MLPLSAIRLPLAAALTFAVSGLMGLRWSHAHAVGAQAAAPLPSGAAALELRVPHAKGAITLDGDADDPGWRADTGRTGPFVGADGVLPARPYSDARFVWGDGYLYGLLYAADEDIRATHAKRDDAVWMDDSFHFVLNSGKTEYAFDVSALGVVADGARDVGAALRDGTLPFDYGWNSGAHTSHELDGTPNASENEDEEWVIEIAIPLDALGLKGEKGERVGLWLRRCDTPKSKPERPGVRSCGSWGAGERRGVLVFTE